MGRRRRGRRDEFDMADIDRMVPVVKLDPARQHWLTVPGRSNCNCDCCNVTKKPSKKALIPAWLFRSDLDDDEPTPELEEEEDQPQLQGQAKLFAQYRVGHIPVPKEELGRGTNDGYKLADKLNTKLSAGERRYTVVCIMPLSSHRDGFFGMPWHSGYRMNETAPTSLGRSRFTTPGRSEYSATNMLQVCSLRLAADGELQRALVYGIVAARDDMEGLPNFIFNRAREDAQEVTMSFPALELSSPVRGISAFEHVLLEFYLKLKTGDDGNGGSDDDDVLIDGCIEFAGGITRYTGRLLRSRIQGPAGSVDMDYMFVNKGVEAAVEVFLDDSCAGCFESMAAVYRVIAGDGRDGDGIVIYDESIPLPPKLAEAVQPPDGGDSGLERMHTAAAATTVVAVPSEGELTVTLKFATAAATEVSCFVRFKAQKVGSCEKKIGEITGPSGEMVPVGLKSSPVLELSSPLRGISAYEHFAGGITRYTGKLLRSRMDYMFVDKGVEAAVEVFLGGSCASCFQSVAAVYRVITGDGGGLRTMRTAVATTVVVVPSEGELTVTLPFAGAAAAAKVSCLARFKAQKVGSCEKMIGEFTGDGESEEVVPVGLKVAWSTVTGFRVFNPRDFL
uniref:DUF6598 domain-containing protein n=1 Tax=Oryza punctata TaxID=4537 RepID=A0A0E0L405_ORYPU